MAEQSKIEWTEATWNPIVGCSVVSPGCTNCYAMKFAARLAQNPATPHYAGTTRMTKAGAVWTGKVALAPAHILDAPLKRTRPTTYFVNSMGDLFHEDVPDSWIDRVFAVMALCPQHTFQVLTKRSKRMREYFDGYGANVRVEALLDEMKQSPLWNGNVVTAMDYLSTSRPLPNVWLGVSCEDQVRADERIPDLLATQAAVRFISAEPLLGPIDLRSIPARLEKPSPFYDLANPYGGGLFDLQGRRVADHRLDWVIAGGESGRGARPMHAAWARSMHGQCQAAGVPFFFKQWGEWLPEDDAYDRSLKCIEAGPPTNGAYRVGKKSAGRMLDGVEHNEMPRARP